MANDQCTADWVKTALAKLAGGNVATLRANNVCWNNAVRGAMPDIQEVEKRLSAATGKRAVVDPSVDGWDGYVAVRFK